MINNNRPIQTRGVWLHPDECMLEQAILIARDHDIDIEEVRRWSVNEGFAEVFEKSVSKRLSEKHG